MKIKTSCRKTFTGGRLQLCIVLLMLFTADRAIGAPDAFPEVDLLRDSVPRYAAVRLDPWGRQTAYILLDGNLNDGYSRCYVWIPGHARYGTPVRQMADGNNLYPPLRFETEGENNEVAVVNWRIRWSRRGRTSRTDYLTGRTVEHGPYIFFPFEVDYRREIRRERDSRLDVTIPGRLSTVSDWEDLRSVQRPWENLRLHVTVERVVERNDPALRVDGYIYHWHQTAGICEFTSIPESFFGINIAISPYTKDPVFMEEVRYQRLRHSGVTVPVEPRWYTVAWEYKLHPWIGGYERRESKLEPVSRVRR